MNKAFRQQGKRPFKVTRYGLIIRRRRAFKMVMVGGVLAAGLSRARILASQGLPAAVAIAKCHLDTTKSILRIMKNEY